MKATTKRRIKQVILSIVGLILFLFAALVYALLWEGSPKHIESVANSFQASSDWRESGYEVMPPKLFCPMANCPEVRRLWETDQPVTYETMYRFLGADKHSIITDEGCEDGTGEVDDLCYFDGYRDGYRYRFSVDKRDSKTIIAFMLRKG